MAEPHTYRTTHYHGFWIVERWHKDAWHRMASNYPTKGDAEKDIKLRLEWFRKMNSVGAKKEG